MSEYKLLGDEWNEEMLKLTTPELIQFAAGCGVELTAANEKLRTVTKALEDYASIDNWSCGYPSKTDGWRDLWLGSEEHGFDIAAEALAKINI